MLGSKITNLPEPTFILRKR